MFAGARGLLSHRIAWRQLLNQLAPKGMGGLQGLKMPDTPCKSAEASPKSRRLAAIDLHDPRSETMVAAPATAAELKPPRITSLPTSTSPIRP